MLDDETFSFDCSTMHGIGKYSNDSNLKYYTNLQIKGELIFIG
jgi:hypothetical protein